MRAVLDTSVLISMALAKGGILEVAWRAWREGKFDVLISRPLISEVRGVLSQPRLARSVELQSRRRLLRDLELLGLPADIIPPYPAAPDPKDSFLLAMAREGGASVIVTGDKALLAMRQWEGAEILTPREFVRAID